MSSGEDAPAGSATVADGTDDTSRPVSAADVAGDDTSRPVSAADDDRELPRRRYLTAVGAAVGGLSAVTGGATATPTADTDCDGGSEPTLAAERDRLQSKRAELQAARDDVDALLEEISSLRAAKRARRTAEPVPIRERAREAGVAVRDHLVGVEVAGSSLLGWPLADDAVLTHTLVLAYRGVEPGTEATATLPDGETTTVELVDRTDEKPPGLALWRPADAVSPVPQTEASSLSPGDELVGVTDVPDRERVITLGELVRRVDDSPASLASTVPAYGVQGGVVATLQGEVVGTIYGSGPRRVPDLPAYLDRPVQAEALPWLSEFRHVPLETVRETVEGWR